MLIGGVETCSDDWCESPDGEGGHDCYAGAWNEPCDCTNGGARLSGETVEYKGNTYYKYTCCTGGSNVGYECGDYSDGHFYGVVVGVPIAIFVFLCLVCVWYTYYHKGSNYHPDAIYIEPDNQQSYRRATTHVAGVQMATFPTAQIVASTANSSNKNKFCGNCGDSLNVGNKFCVNCRARIKKKKRENIDMYW